MATSVVLRRNSLRRQRVWRWFSRCCVKENPNSRSLSHALLLQERPAERRASLSAPHFAATPKTNPTKCTYTPQRLAPFRCPLKGRGRPEAWPFQQERRRVWQPNHSRTTFRPAPHRGRDLPRLVGRRNSRRQATELGAASLRETAARHVRLRSQVKSLLRLRG